MIYYVGEALVISEHLSLIYWTQEMEMHGLSFLIRI
jgi:hypothetical protein